MIVIISVYQKWMLQVSLHLYIAHGFAMMPYYHTTLLKILELSGKQLQGKYSTL